MTEQEIGAKLEDLSAKMDKVFASAEKTRKYFLWTIIVSVVVFVVPLIAILFVAPSFLSTYTSQLQGLDPNSIGY